MATFLFARGFSHREAQGWDLETEGERGFAEFLPVCRVNA